MNHARECLSTNPLSDLKWDRVSVVNARVRPASSVLSLNAMLGVVVEEVRLALFQSRSNLGEFESAFDLASVSSVVSAPDANVFPFSILVLCTSCYCTYLPDRVN